MQPQKINYKEKFDLTDKTVLITGGCGLIGKAFVEACAQFGASVIVADIPKAQPEKFAEQLSLKYNGKIFGVSVDVTQRQEVKNLLIGVLIRFKKIDGLWIVNYLRRLIAMCVTLVENLVIL